jgi:signal transduction histidine kinase
MKQKFIRLPQRYAAALERHVAQVSPAGLLAALGLGREMVAHGWETLDLAKIHNQAVVALLLPGHSASKKAGVSKRAMLFFTEANVPMEETNRAARLTDVQLGQLRRSLAQRTKALATADLQLRKGIQKRKTMADAFADSGRVHRQCLAESLQLQNHLRKLSHHVLEAQENERTRISRELQDEIVQTLVGINVRLLTLQKEAHTNSDGIKKHIANAQRLVVRSAKSVDRMAQELAPPPPAKKEPAARAHRGTATSVRARTYT